MKSKRLNCKIGANCKGSCIQKSKSCQPVLSPKNKDRVIKAAEKLHAPITQVKIKAFVKSGKISAAAQLLEDLRSRTSPIDAAILTGKIKVDKSLIKDANDFNQLTGLELKRLKEIRLLPERSSADIKAGIITIDSRNGPDRQRASVFHEMGHFLERQSPDNIKKANDFVLSKATGPKELLSKIMNDNRYGPSESAYPGNFLNAYVGKTYLSGATEVISVGLEHFVSPLALSKFFKAAPDHMELVAGML